MVMNDIPTTASWPRLQFMYARTVEPFVQDSLTPSKKLIVHVRVGYAEVALSYAVVSSVDHKSDCFLMSHLI